MLQAEIEDVQQTTINILVSLAPYVTSNENDMKRYALLIYPCIQNGEISHGKAAEILGITKNDLLDIYGEIGIPYYNQTCEELKKDIDVLRTLRSAK